MLIEWPANIYYELFQYYVTMVKKINTKLHKKYLTKCDFFIKIYYVDEMKYQQRGVAQFGRVPGLGPGGRRFESCRSDH